VTETGLDRPKPRIIAQTDLLPSYLTPQLLVEKDIMLGPALASGVRAGRESWLNDWTDWFDVKLYQSH